MIIHTVNISSLDGAWELEFAPQIQAYSDLHKLRNVGAQQIFAYSELIDKFRQNRIGENDIFIFSDLFDDSLLDVARLLRIHKKPNCKIVAFWGNYQPHEYIYTSGTKFYHNFEYFRIKALLNATHEIYFRSNIERDEFIETLEFVPYNELKDKCKIFNIPLDYLDIVHTKAVNETTISKIHSVIIPHRPINTFVNNGLCQDFQRKFKAIIPLPNISYDAFQRQLALSKVALFPYMERPNEQILYECRVLDVVPLISDKYKDLFPYEDFLYPSEWTEDILSYSANWQHLKKRVDIILSRFNEWVEIYKSVEFNQNTEELLKHLTMNLK